MKRNKLSVIFSVVSFFLVSVLLVGIIFSFGNEGVTSFRKIFKGSNSVTDFDVKLFWKNNLSDDWINSAASSEVPLNNSVKWEPGRREIRYFKVSNEGNIDFNYQLNIKIPSAEMTAVDYAASKPLGDVIDVYYSSDVNNLSSREKIGTLNECFIEPQIVEAELSAKGNAECALTFEMQTTAGNEYQGKYNSENINTTSVGFVIEAIATADDNTEPDYDGFSFVLGSDDILYRVGNGNQITASKLFNGPSEAKDELVTFSSSVIAGNPGVTYTASTTSGSRWTNGTFNFSGSGVINLLLKYNGKTKVNVNLEVVDGKNITSSSSATTNNVVLLNDIESSSFTVSGYAVYGNGFSITDKRSSTSGTAGFLNISNGGILDNVCVIGQEYPEVVYSGNTNEYYSPCISITGTGGKIFNSLVSGCRYAVLLASGNLIVENSLICGGTLANISVGSGNLTIKNSITSKSISPDASYNGVGIFIQNVNSKVYIEGTFAQYNWLQKSELPSTIQTVLSSAYSESTLAYKNDGKTYVHAGIVCMSESTAFTQETAEAAVINLPRNEYTSFLKTASSVTAVLFAQKSSTGSAEKIAGISSYTSAGQYPTLPSVKFDYTTLNYIAKTADSNTYCYYDSNTGKVNISFEEDDGSFKWNPMILTVKKYGSDIPYSVEMNSVNYNGNNISFSSAGDYTVSYSFTDSNYYYGSAATKSSITYSENVYIDVVMHKPDVVVYHPEFKFGSDYSVASKKVIINNSTYVMPDISSASSSYESKSINGQTVYYPVVTVDASTSSGGTYSSGGIYCFAPAFSSVRIIDYNQDTGATQYTYNTSTKTWPHNQNSSNGPDTSVYNYATTGTSPYESASGTSSQGKTFISSKGLCFSTSNLERDVSKADRLVKFYYVGNDGTTYYYYICYRYTATTHSSSTCFASGTTVTMANGFEKPVESLNLKDKIMSWNFYDGRIEEKEICLLVDHGKNIYDILNLEFSDGSKLKVIEEHGLYDYKLNDFVYINKQNYDEFIGHKFIKYNPNGKYKKVKLINAYMTKEETNSYSIATVDNLNAFANGLLTLTPPGDYYNPVKKGRKLRYNIKEMKKDIEKYGLYKYEDFKDYLTPYQFYSFNVDYMKVPVSKGEITYEYILTLIEGYSKYFA